MNKVILTGNAWIPEEIVNILRKRGEKWERILIGFEGFPEITEDEKFKRHLKYALVDNHKLIYVHNETMEGYVTEGYELKEPLEKCEYKNFIRWARGMDI